MIAILVTSAFVFYLAISLFQIIYVSFYCWKTRLPQPITIDDRQSYCPTAAIVLCLRGDDPALSDCLEGIAWQSYPDFQLFCVLDHPNDPANQILKDNSYKFTRPPKTIVVDAVSPSRSLKCNSLLCAIDAIGSAYEVIAFIDADTVPDPRWLSDLVQPLGNLQIGVTTGNRWFSASDHQLGSLLRQTWNAAAVVQMILYRIAWGGSWAARRETLLDSQFRQHLETAFCEDTALNGAFGDKTVHCVPHLVTLNNETTNLRGAFGFIVRQLLTLRLYHRAWPLVLCHGLIILAAGAISIIAMVLLVLSADWQWTILLGVCIACFQLVNLLLLIFIERQNRQILAYRDTIVRSVLEDSPGLFLLSVVAAQVVHPVAIIKAWLARTATWRGIEYRIMPQSKVRMVQYQPYESVVRDPRSIQ